METSNFITFDEFMKGTANARHEDFVARGAVVSERAEFEKMRRHILSLYEGVSAKHSFIRVVRTWTAFPSISSHPCEPRAVKSPNRRSSSPGTRRHQLGRSQWNLLSVEDKRIASETNNIARRERSPCVASRSRK
jgi:hypothetical protein